MLVRGDNVVLYINVLGTWTPYVCGRVVTANYSTDFIETSVSGSGLWKTFLPTANGFTFSIEGVVDLNESGVLTLADLREMQFNQERLLVKVVRTDEAGDTYTEQGYAYISSSSDTGSFDGMNTFSVDTQGTGAVVQQSTVPPPSLILRENGTDFISMESGSDFILRE